MKAVILAERISRKVLAFEYSKKPKQILDIFSDNSLIRETFEKLNYKLEPKDIFVVTAEKHNE